MGNHSVYFLKVFPGIQNSKISHLLNGLVEISKIHNPKQRVLQQAFHIPYSRESPPMGAASYFLTKQGGWALFRVIPHSTLKERPPLFSSAIAAIEQQARVSQSPPSTSTSLESLATSPLTTSSSLPPSAG